MAQPLNAAQLVAYRCYNTLVPYDGPKTVPLFFDFTTQPEYIVDLGLAEMEARIPFVQCIYADNSLNTGALIVTVAGSHQTLTFPAGYQGYLPVVAPNPAKFMLSLATGGVNANTGVQFLSCFIPPILWNAA